MDEKTGQIKATPYNEEENKKGIIDQYYFHSKHWAALKKKNMTVNIPRSQGKQKMTMKTLNSIAD